MSNFSIFLQVKNNIFKSPSPFRFAAFQTRNIVITFNGGIFRHHALCVKKG